MVADDDAREQRMLAAGARLQREAEALRHEARQARIALSAVNDALDQHVDARADAATCHEKLGAAQMCIDQVERALRLLDEPPPEAVTT